MRRKAFADRSCDGDHAGSAPEKLLVRVSVSHACLLKLHPPRFKICGIPSETAHSYQFIMESSYRAFIRVLRGRVVLHHRLLVFQNGAAHPGSVVCDFNEGTACWW